MNNKLKSFIAVILSICMVLSANGYMSKTSTGAATLANVANGRNGYTFMTSNANTPVEGFLYVGNGFSAINTCNENLGNGNNLLGATATTAESAIYVDFGKKYDISSALIYQGSTNVNFYDSYCRNYTIYYSTEQVSAANAGNITWSLAGTCTEGTIYSGAKIKNAEYVSDSGDEIIFESTYTARSVKIVFDKNSCMGTGTNGNNTGTTGTLSLLSVRIYGTEIQAETTTDEAGEIETTSGKVEETTAEIKEDDIMNVLFVGNSMTYYNTLCKVVEGIAKIQGRQIQCTASTQGGQNLIYHTTYSGTVSAIQSGEYDVVVLQDIVGSFDGDKLMKGATTLTNMVKEYNPDANVLLYMPWPVKGNLTGETSLLPYFTYNYIKTARTLGASLAPAGEAWYELYNKYTDVAWYCNDEKHPHAIGTFVSACSVYYALFPEAEKVTIDNTNQEKMNKIINDNIAYSGDGVTQYESSLLDDISYYAYNYAHAVTASVEDTTGKTKYTSVAGTYTDADDEVDKTGLTEVTGTEVDKSVFTKENGNIAVGCSAYASNERQKASYATDGNTGTRWETDYEDSQWLYVDLGAVKNIDKVGFMWEGAYASKYYVQVSDDANDWKTVAMVTAASNKNVQIELESGVSGRYVRMYGTRRGSQYGYSFYEMGVWESCKVSVDGEDEYVKPGSTYILGNAKYGYYSEGKMYPSGYEYTVDKDVSFTSVNELSVSIKNAAAIKTSAPTGLRFKATVQSDNMDAVAAQDAVTEGILLTTEDIYDQNGQMLKLESDYTKLIMSNSGWFKETEESEIGTYCGSVVNIYESNYERTFIARAYVTVTYADGSTENIYSDGITSRTVKYVAEQVIANGYVGILEGDKSLINTFAGLQ
ncbi:MAG: discoidin domain-containing protein [Eubacterium sp.]